MTSATLTVESAQEAADQATRVADEIRTRVELGDTDVQPSELAEAERDEAFAQRALTAARQREVARLEREQAEWLAAERVEVQQLWSRYQSEPAELITARATAAAGCRDYLAAYVEHVNKKDQLARRAIRAGFAVDDPDSRSTRPSPLPGLAQAIKIHAADLLDHQWTRPLLDANNDRVWGE